MQNDCKNFRQEPGSLEQLDVEQTLARLTAKEEQGVSFVNIEQTDRKAERVRGALVGAGLFTRSVRRVCRRSSWRVIPSAKVHSPSSICRISASGTSSLRSSLMRRRRSTSASE